MNEFNDLLCGISNHEQDQTHIRRMWDKSPLESKSHFLDWLGCDNPGETLKELPDSWIVFVQSCCLAGLRGSVISGIESNINLPLVFEVNRCYMTRDGQKATILGIESDREFPVVAVIETKKFIEYKTDGRCDESREHPFDLVAIWEDE